MIYTLTLNPAIDRELTVDEIEYNKVLSAMEARVDLGGKGFAGLDFAARDHDVGAGARKGEDHFAAETAATAGDKGYFAGEVEE